MSRMQDRPRDSCSPVSSRTTCRGHRGGSSTRARGGNCVNLEARLGAAAEAREADLLAQALGEAPAGRDALALSQALVARLDTGTDAALEWRAWRALVEIVRGKLAIAKPGHDAWDFGAELD
jgi:hypothetical protein